MSKKLDLSSLDVIGLFQSMGLEYKTSGKNVSAGWINIKCNSCMDHGHHLGVNLKSKMYSCWICRDSGSIFSLIKKITKKSNKEVFDILRPFLGKIVHDNYTKPTTKKSQKVVLPTFSMDKPLKIHANYLKERGFDHKFLETVFGIKYTGQISKYKSSERVIDFKFRIIIPIYINGVLVNFTARDVSGCSDERYKNCPNDDALISTKDSIYGYDSIRGDTVVLVEGPTDVWALGPGALGIFGLKYTENQIKLLYGKELRKCIIFLDNEPTAQKIAKKLAREIGSFIPEVGVLTPDKEITDPGAMTKEQVKKMWRIVYEA